MVIRMTDPFQALLDLQRGLGAARRSNWFGSGTSSVGAYPPVNVFHRGDDFVVVAELPGVDKSDLDIQVKNNRLRISGKKSTDFGKDASVHRRERVAGQFDRTITIPARVDSDRVKAEYRNGMLAIFLPRAEADKPRSVDID